jgi:hypothetical protein
MKKVLDFKDGGSIYAFTTVNGYDFIPVGISYESATEKLRTWPDENLALMIIASWN